MKQLYPCALLAILVLSCSFTGIESERNDNKGSFSATINGKPFKLSDDQILKGTMTSKAGSLDGRSTSHNVITFNFQGASYTKKDGHSFTESVQLEMNFIDGKTPEASLASIGLQFESNDYSMIKEECKLNVTQISWEPDHHHMLITGDFDCKMRSWGYPFDGKSDASLKGHLTNIRVAVPSWIVAKL